MAARSGDIPHDRLHHFVSAGVWDSALPEATLRRHSDHLVGGTRSWLIIKDTSLPKKGEHSVGVAPQYASTLGRKANRQTPEKAIEEIDRPCAAGVRSGCGRLADAGYGLSAPFLHSGPERAEPALDSRDTTSSESLFRRCRTRVSGQQTLAHPGRIRHRPQPGHYKQDPGPTDD
ncbi:hypothetical protein CFR76_11250 [Komagataeibacter swingsii]|uniref:Transposase IS701-like DDE domain-containing protein n=1 Tax=Komagataeibacter swingsii TaxID=215220 RepID=A0A2V4SB77_9PROT|nr:hypothetical protein CFR76_11250 [Komagataeibacter swingsii]